MGTGRKLIDFVVRGTGAKIGEGLSKLLVYKAHDADVVNAPVPIVFSPSRVTPWFGHKNRGKGKVA